jgi:hypothetical protein
MMNKFNINIAILFFVTIFFISCKDFVEVDPPKSDLVKSTIFTSDETATSAVMDLYYQFINAGYSTGSLQSLTFYGTVLGDEAISYVSDQQMSQFGSNSLVALNSYVNSLFWTSPYKQILRSNMILEGISSAQGISSSLKLRSEAEAKFLRAFAHFYLVNLFGDVPLVLTSDYRTNAVISRTAQKQVYEQIVQDLKDAEQLLSDDYLEVDNKTISGQRSRINKASASAMLARVYLFMGEWSKAEIQSTRVINNPLYRLQELNKVFLANSTEAIWQLSRNNSNALEASAFTIFSTPRNGALRLDFVQQFDDSDLRKKNWISNFTSAGITYYFPSKYKAATTTPPNTENSMVLRLGEQYLIRAEARIQQNNISEGISDLNIIRMRARPAATVVIPNPLPDLSLSLNKTDALLAVENERKFELFTEWGHRWLDLKRTRRADAVLGPIKGQNWQSTDQLFPIPQVQLLNDPGMTSSQNPGYN